MLQRRWSQILLRGVEGRNDGCELQQGKFQRDVSKNSLQWGIAEYWSRLPRETGNTVLGSFQHSAGQSPEPLDPTFRLALI